jgi:hypothetical protein
MPNRNVNLAAEFKSSGKTQRAFCAERGISIDTLRYYLYKRGIRRIPLQSAAKSRSVCAPPAFLSFNRERFTGTSSRSRCTIIMGSFSLADIAELLSGAFRV